MNYPGRTIQQQDEDIEIVKAIQLQLNKRGCGPVKIDGDYGIDTMHAISLFQARFADANGNPLKADGIAGPVTWTALFGVKNSLKIISAPNSLLTAVLDVARSQIGVMEFPSGSNDGPAVNKYQDAANIAHGQHWAMAFIYWCFKQACINLEIANPVYKTGDVLNLWTKAEGKKILPGEAASNASLVLPGQLFIISTGGGLGHTGFIERNESGLLTTIEGNTCIDCVNNGIGVFRRNGRTIDSINTGFIQF